MPSYATMYAIFENHESTVADMTHLFFMSKCLCLFICTLYVCMYVAVCLCVCLVCLCVCVSVQVFLPVVSCVLKHYPLHRRLSLSSMLAVTVQQ